MKVELRATAPLFVSGHAGCNPHVASSDVNPTNPDAYDRGAPVGLLGGHEGAQCPAPDLNELVRASQTEAAYWGKLIGAERHPRLPFSTRALQVEPGNGSSMRPDRRFKPRMSSDNKHDRFRLTMPKTGRIGLITDDARDPDTTFPSIAAAMVLPKSPDLAKPGDSKCHGTAVRPPDV
jgi:hypothetical protein